MYLLVHLLSAFCETDVVGEMGINGSDGGDYGDSSKKLLGQGS